MRRSLSHRFAAFLLATWFVVGWGELLPVHDCPMHRASVPMAGMASHHMPMPGDSRDAPAQDTHHECTCPGKCAAVSGSTAAPTPIVAAGAILVRHDAPAAHDEQVRRPDEARRLPFAIGPPSLA